MGGAKQLSVEVRGPQRVRNVALGVADGPSDPEHDPEHRPDHRADMPAPRTLSEGSGAEAPSP